MPKVLRCGDLMPGCNAVIEGKDEAEVMAKGHPRWQPRSRRPSKTRSNRKGSGVDPSPGGPGSTQPLHSYAAIAGATRMTT